MNAVPQGIVSKSKDTKKDLDKPITFGPMKLFKEIPKDNGVGTILQEVDEPELRAESQNHIVGKPHTHIFGPDKYAASGWYERKCVICGHIEYI